MEISNAMIEALQDHLGKEGVYVGDKTCQRALTAALNAEPCEPVAWMFEGKGWGREVMLSEQEALERKERLSRTWDITITPLYSSPAPSLGVDIEALQRRVEELEAALQNMMGVYDTTLSRRRFPPDEFMKEAIETARAALIQEQKKYG
jgi:hypothetical protein